MIRSITFTAVIILTTSGPPSASATSPPTIDLPQAVHFLTPSGEDVVAGPGTYEVEAAKEGLRIKRTDEKDTEALLIQSIEHPHQESLDIPKVQSEPGPQDDQHRLILLLPEGRGWEATGTYSGARSRGIFAGETIDGVQITDSMKTNTATGVGALSATILYNTTAIENTATGIAALNLNTIGIRNTATGAYAMRNNSEGYSNTATGAHSLRYNTTGHSNTAIGAHALLMNTIGNQNTAIGFGALRNNSEGINNTANGYQALSNNSKGTANTAIGHVALQNNSTGGNNTAVGSYALFSNNDGGANTAMGTSALKGNSTGGYNTALGSAALISNTSGSANTVIGYKAMHSNISGGGNVAVGSTALGLNTTGNNNVAIGGEAGRNLTGGNNNIYINHRGNQIEYNTIRIGNPELGTTVPVQVAQSPRTFVAGIVTSAVLKGVPVMVSPDGQLGVQASSLRYKEDVRDMNDVSQSLYKLRPVTFRYKGELAGKDAVREYGLIAEEVAEVYPDLVGRDTEGQIVTVKYHELIPMLLNEVQKEHRQVEQLNQWIAKQQQQIQVLATRVAELEAAK